MFDYQGYMKQGLEHCLRMVAQRGVELGQKNCHNIHKLKNASQIVRY